MPHDYLKWSLLLPLTKSPFGIEGKIISMQWESATTKYFISFRKLKHVTPITLVLLRYNYTVNYTFGLHTMILIL